MTAIVPGMFVHATRRTPYRTTEAHGLVVAVEDPGYGLPTFVYVAEAGALGKSRWKLDEVEPCADPAQLQAQAVGTAAHVAVTEDPDGYTARLWVGSACIAIAFDPHEQSDLRGAAELFGLISQAASDAEDDYGERAENLCPDCRGRGTRDDDSGCRACGGTGSAA